MDDIRVSEQAETFRKLATVRRIKDIKPIEGADLIELAVVDGWQVVVKKGEYKVGDFAVYLEIDSWVPTTLAPFLTKGDKVRTYNGVNGERLRTIKLRGQLSQGLLLPTGCVPGIVDEGQDVTELLGIQKWERPIPTHLAGVQRGNFPSFIPKTDQERIQNIPDLVRASYENRERYEVTMKLDGSSMTVYAKYNEDKTELDIGVCSRNLSLKLDQEGNAFVNTAKATGALNAVKEYAEKTGRSLALQGELCGPNIQGNSLALDDCDYYLFDIYDIDAQRYLPPFERFNVYKEMLVQGATFRHVPFVRTNAFLFSANIDKLLEMAEGKLPSGAEAEGLVFKRVDGQFSFKAISNKYLLAKGE